MKGCIKWILSTVRSFRFHEDKVSPNLFKEPRGDHEVPLCSSRASGVLHCHKDTGNPNTSRQPDGFATIEKTTVCSDGTHLVEFWSISGLTPPQRHREPLANAREFTDAQIIKSAVQ